MFAERKIPFRIVIVAIVSSVALAFLLRWFLRGESESDPVVKEVTVAEPIPEKPLVKEIDELREEEPIVSIKQPRLLREYGSAALTPREDLELVDSVLKRFWRLLKNPDLIRVGSNAEIIESLTGGNPEGIEFISPSNRFIDTEGQLLDRWGTPLFFHPLSMTDIEIRSAGPDTKLFTDDDVLVSKAR